MQKTQDLRKTDYIRWNKRRIIIWTVTALSLLTAYFHRTVIGVVSDSLMRDFAIERATDLGLLASIYFWTYAAMQLPGGIMADVFGPRRMISFALLVSVVGSLLFGTAESLAVLYAGRFITTLGIGLIFVSLIKLQADWFRVREFATMSGLLVLIGNSGSLLSATPMAFIVDSWGWRSAFYLIAAYSFLMAAACWAIVRNRPEDIGLPGVAEFEAYEGKPAAVAKGPAASIAENLRGVFRNRRTWPPIVAGTTIYGVFMSIVGVWGVPYFMQVHHMSRVESSQFIVAMFVGNMIGAPMVGFISDRIFYRRWPFMAATTIFLSGLMLLTFWYGAKPPAALLYPLSFSFGLGVSGISLSVTCVKEANSPQATGIAAGLTNSGPFIGAAIMQPAFGWILDRNWAGAVDQGIKVYPQSAYESAFGLCIAVLCVGLTASFLIKESPCDFSQPRSVPSSGMQKNRG